MQKNPQPENEYNMRDELYRVGTYLFLVENVPVRRLVRGDAREREPLDVVHVAISGSRKLFPVVLLNHL